MDVAISNGFYVDPDTNKTFFVKKVYNRLLYPHWVKSKPSDWKPINSGGNKDE